MNFHEARMAIKECSTHSQLLKVVENLVANQKEYKLDDYEMGKLEEIGMSKYERIERDMKFAAKNTKGRK